MSRIAKLLTRLSRSTSGLAATEMALTMPFLLSAGLWAVELSNFALTNMQVSQLAVQIADNASRIGEQSQLQERKIYESDINDLLEGASLQGGKSMALFDEGRAIISSLEVNPDKKGDKQYIHWQRCLGKKKWSSNYGDEGDELKDGIGPKGEEVYAFQGEAVMFVELAFDYKPLISARFVGDPTIRAIASFTVREKRDLSKVYQRDSTAPDKVADCKKFDNPYPA